MIVGVLLMPNSLMAQKYALDLSKPKIEKLTSPDLGGSIARKSFKPKDWLEVELKMNIKAQNRKEKFADKVTVKWYIAVKNPEGGKGLILLEKEVTHVNVPIGEDIYVSVYFSPSAIKRITGRDSFSKGMIENAAGVIVVNGVTPSKKTGMFTMKGKAGWWNKGSITRYDKIPLRNKDETPFKIFWYDRYAEIETKR